jgi:hypothetical protein
MTLTGSKRWTRSLLAAPAVLACTQAATEPVVELRRGVLEFHGDPPHVQAPATASLGTPVIVTVRTYGGGCIKAGPTSAAVQGLVAVIEPFDSVVTRLPPNWACTQELRLLSHVTTLQFADRGTATIRILGRREPGDSPLSIERTIVVQ